MKINVKEFFKANGYDTLDVGEVSDGYHTFDELYFHRMVLFKIILKTYEEKAWKSKLHADGTMFDNYFIVGIDTPKGQYSYHYNLDFWNEFDGIKELEKAPEWDGHEPSDIKRLESLLTGGFYGGYSQIKVTINRRDFLR